MTAPSPVVELVDVERTFPPDVRALRGVTMSVAPGERVAIMGPSGSGKSTLLSIVGLLDQPSAGTYRLDGQETATMSERDVTRLRGAAIGFVFQAFHLVPHLTVLENVELGMFSSSRSRAERAEQAAQQLETLELGDRFRAFPPTLSGGERQRVAIARACVKKPKLLLCDEPTGSLDSETSAVVLEQILGAVDDGQALVIVTHAPEVAALADRTITIRDGQVR